MPGCMLTIGFWQREALLVWQLGRAPLVAAGVALVVWLLGRGLRSALLQAAAAGMALCVGWGLALGGVPVVPLLPAERLPVLAVAALAVGLAVDLFGLAAGLARSGLVVAAGWWLAGAPRSDAGAGLVLPQMACLALAVLLALRLLRAPGGAWSACAAALALWGALAATGTAAVWTTLALVLVAASLGRAGAPGATETARLPMAAGLAGLAGLAWVRRRRPGTRRRLPMRS